MVKIDRDGVHATIPTRLHVSLSVARHDFKATGEGGTAIFICKPEAAKERGRLKKHLLSKSDYVRQRNPHMEAEVDGRYREIVVVPTYREKQEASFTVNVHCVLPITITPVRSSGSVRGGGGVGKSGKKHSKSAGGSIPGVKFGVGGGGAGKSGAVWSRSEKGSWVPYDAASTKMLEDAFNHGQTTCSLKVPGSGTYLLDFNAMHQTSPRGYTRDIKRDAGSASGSGGGGGGGGGGLNDDVTVLHEMFPKLKLHQIKDTLAKHTGNLNAAVIALLK